MIDNDLINDWEAFVKTGAKIKKLFHFIVGCLVFGFSMLLIAMVYFK